MARRSRLDSQAGVLPLIRPEGDSVTFDLSIVRPKHSSARLLLRCDEEGNVWASIPERVRLLAPSAVWP